MSAWRQVGLNYINYSNIAAKILRRSLKPEFERKRCDEMNPTSELLHGPMANQPTKRINETKYLQKTAAK